MTVTWLVFHSMAYGSVTQSITVFAKLTCDNGEHGFNVEVTGFYAFQELCIIKDRLIILVEV